MRIYNGYEMNVLGKGLWAGLVIQHGPIVYRYQISLTFKLTVSRITECSFRSPCLSGKYSVTGFCGDQVYYLRVKRYHCFGVPVYKSKSK